MNKFFITAVTSLSLLLISSGNVYSTEVENAVPDEPITHSVRTAVVAKEEAKDGSKQVLSQLGETAKEIGSSFPSDYMTVATAVELKVTEALEERRKQGLSTNKFVEIGYRIKFMGPMLAFMGKRVLWPVAKLVAAI